MSWGILTEMADPRRRHKTKYLIVARMVGRDWSFLPTPVEVPHRPRAHDIGYRVVGHYPDGGFRDDAEACPLCQVRSSNARG